MYSGKQAVLIAYFFKAQMDGLQMIKTAMIICDSTPIVSIFKSSF